MAATHHPHIALTEPLGRILDEPIVEGRCASASEVVRAAPRLLERQETKAQPETQDGGSDG